MAQEVGDLRVRLSLDDAAFGRSITSMNRTLQAMGQEIRGLQNRGKEWGSSIDGLKTKQEAYSRLLEGQQTKVRRLAEEYEKAKQQYGEHSTQAEKLAVQLNRASAEMERTERELSEITAELERQERELAQSQTAWGRLGTALTEAGAKLKEVGSQMTDVGKSLSMKVTAPIVALGTGAVAAAIDFESAFAGVRKTVGTTEEGFAKLEKGILEMARTLPASASDIAVVAESAGQLGIAEENILSFTRTIIDLGEATNLSAEQGASEFARFANIVGMSQNDFDRLGSSIVGLGNTMATTESEIMSMAMRLAAQGSQVGLSEAQILALSATMSSLGIEAEAGGTAMTTVLKKMQNAVSAGGAELESFANAAKVSSSEFSAAFKEDAATALDMLIKGLAQSTEEGANLNDILDNMGIKGIREADTMLRMAGAADLFNAAMETSGEAWEKNTALSNEAEQRYATTASQLQMLKNRLVEVGISFGQVLLPFLIQIVETLTPIITKFAEMDSSIQMVILAIAGIAAAIGPALIVIGMLISSIGSIMGVLGPISTAIAQAGGLMAFLSSKLAALGTAFTALTGPVGLTVLAIGGIVTALVVAYNKVDWFREGVNNLFRKIKDFTMEIFNAVKTTITSLVSSTVDFAKGILDRFKDFWGENGKAISGIVQLHFGFIKGNIEMVMGIIKGIFEVVWPIISGVVKIAWETIQLTIGNALELILGTIQFILKLIQGDWAGAWNTIKQTAENIMNNIVKFFKDIDLYQIGKDIIQGLINGIGSMAGAVWDKVKSITDGIKNAITGALQINSPSKLTTQYGKWVGEGLAIGMDKSLDMVKRAANGLATITSESMNVGLGNGSNSNSYDYSKSFAPVVHINTVDSGAKEMNRTLRRMAYGIL